MPFNGSGTYTFPSLPGSFNPAISGQAATPGDWNTLAADLTANGLTNTICKDGQTVVTANIPFAGFQLKLVGAGTAVTDAANVGQIQSGAGVYALDTGTADLYAIAPTPAISAYAVGQLFRWKVLHANLTTTPTLAVNGLTAGTIVWPDGSALAATDLPVGAVVQTAVSNVTTGTPTYQLVTPAHFSGTGALVKASAPTITSAILTTIDTTSTAVTQSPGDNSTKLATTAYVATAVGTAPRIVAMCNSTGTTINKGFNVTSITKNSSGNFTFNLTANIDANAVIGATAFDATSSGDCVVLAQTVSTVTIGTYNSLGSPQDFTGIHMTAHA